MLYVMGTYLRKLYLTTYIKYLIFQTEYKNANTYHLNKYVSMSNVYNIVDRKKLGQISFFPVL